MTDSKKDECGAYLEGTSARVRCKRPIGHEGHHSTFRQGVLGIHRESAPEALPFRNDMMPAPEQRRCTTLGHKMLPNIGFPRCEYELGHEGRCSVECLLPRSHSGECFTANHHLNLSREVQELYTRPNWAELVHMWLCHPGRACADGCDVEPIPERLAIHNEQGKLDESRVIVPLILEPRRFSPNEMSTRKRCNKTNTIRYEPLKAELVRCVRADGHEGPCSWQIPRNFEVHYGFEGEALPGQPPIHPRVSGNYLDVIYWRGSGSDLATDVLAVLDDKELKRFQDEFERKLKQRKASQ